MSNWIVVSVKGDLTFDVKQPAKVRSIDPTRAGVFGDDAIGAALAVSTLAQETVVCVFPDAEGIVDQLATALARLKRAEARAAKADA